MGDVFQDIRQSQFSRFLTAAACSKWMSDQGRYEPLSDVQTKPLHIQPGSLRPLGRQVLPPLRSLPRTCCAGAQGSVFSPFIWQYLGSSAGAQGPDLKLQTMGKGWNSSFCDISFFQPLAALSQLARVLAGPRVAGSSIEVFICILFSLSPYLIVLVPLLEFKILLIVRCTAIWYFT